MACFITLLIPLMLLSSCVKSEIVLTNLVWRHGDRSTLHPFKNDPVDLWPRGLGQLTNQGIKQEYNLGKFLREEYKNLVGVEYNLTDIYVRSTTIDRALMSAQAVMDAFYRPNAKELWNGKNTSWFPVPIHTVPEDEDILLLPYDTVCPNYKKYQLDVFKSKWYLNFVKNHTDILNFVAKKMNFDSISMFNLSHIHDNLFCKQCNNKPLPKWATNELITKLHNIHGATMGLGFGWYDYKNSLEVARMMFGTYIKEVIKNMDDKISGNTTRSIFAYSGHDTTLVGILMAMKTFNHKIPYYGSLLMIELHKEEGNYFVTVRYRNDTSHDPYPISFLGCQYKCPLSSFKSIALQVIPEDRNVECGIVSTEEVYVQRYKIAFLFLGLFLLISWIVIGILIKRIANKGRKNIAYSPVVTDDADLIT